ncbi:caspase family protein [bacterium]|nr:caspase family protein [bacterium]MBU1152398.1 caspase family protein [bacterium]MBU1782372.1 caspase family protein [bacterium]MBU2599958.1 caspase family protein [bacterium]
MANKVLLVGINKYKIPGSDLNGCLNDVSNVRDVLLKYFGFAVKEIRVVIDERAKKKAIMERLKWLVKGTKAGDRLLFHFSGHGSQVRDRDGDELKDRLDEILCPHDMDWDGTYITDDELGKIFSELPKGVNLEVLLDSCHSGTGTREIIGISALPQELSFKPRFLHPPLDIQCRIEDDLEVKKILKGGNPLNHVLFSSCKDNQTSADANIGGSYNGAFTYYFCKHLRETQGNITRGELLKRLRVSLKFNGFSQVPQLECPGSEKKKKVLE